MLRGRRKVVYGAGAVLVVVAAIVVGVVLVNRSAPTRPVAYTNISRNFKTCLLTTTADTTATVPVWTALQAAAAHRPINVQHVVAPSGPSSELVPYLNSLVALHCQLIVTAGSGLAATVTEVAKDHPRLRFVNISTATIGLANVQDVPASTPANITRLVTTACGCQ